MFLIWPRSYFESSVTAHHMAPPLPVSCFLTGWIAGRGHLMSFSYFFKVYLSRDWIDSVSTRFYCFSITQQRFGSGALRAAWRLNMLTWRFIRYVGPQFYILGHGLYVFWCPARFVLFFSSTLTIGESLCHSFIISKLNLMWNIHQIGTWCVHKNEHRCKVSSVVFSFLGIVLLSDFLLCDEACWLYVAQRLMINWALWPAWLLTVHSVSR